MRVCPQGIRQWVVCPVIAAVLLLTAGGCAGNHALDRQLLARAAEATPAELHKLIQAGANVNAQDRFGVTPLMQAVIGNNTAALRTLLAAGADPRMKDFLGDTAIDLARALSRTEMLKLLGGVRAKHSNRKMAM